MARREQRETGPLTEVRLRGRLSGEPEERVLPSGDTVVGFRVVVDRPAADREKGRAGVDTLDCAAFRAGPRRAVLRCGPGDIVEVSGALHRRFYAAASGRASRYEVEAVAVSRVARAGTAPEAGRDTMAG